MLQRHRYLLYGLTIVLPPAGVAVTRQYGLTAVNLLFWLMCLPVSPIAIIHAVYLVSDWEQEQWRQRKERMEAAYREAAEEFPDTFVAPDPGPRPFDPRHHISLLLLGVGVPDTQENRQLPYPNDDAARRSGIGPSSSSSSLPPPMASAFDSGDGSSAPAFRLRPLAGPPPSAPSDPNAPAPWNPSGEKRYW